MKKIVATLMVLVIAQTVQAQKGFKPIFDGKTTTG